MGRPRTRAEATEARKSAIRRAALECFVELGYDQTTIEDIRRRAGASTGSIYHHFGSKERLAADVYLEGVRDTQRVVLAALESPGSVERAIHALVDAYLGWYAEHPDYARYLLTMRHGELLPDVADELGRLNAEFLERLQAWFATHEERGELPRLDLDLYMALLTGPCDSFARRWLRGRTRTDFARAAKVLGDAAWYAVRDLRASAPSGGPRNPAAN